MPSNTRGATPRRPTSINMSQELEDRLTQSAKAGWRTRNDEILMRLEQSYGATSEDQFPEAGHCDPERVVSVRMSQTLADALTASAKTNGRSRNKEILTILQKGLK